MNRRNDSLTLDTPTDMDKPKHSHYLLQIMAEVKTSKYFLIAEDLTSLMKESTEQLCTSISEWKGRKLKNLDLLKGQDEDQLTIFGKRIIEVCEILAELQNKDPITFWTNGEREEIFKIMIPLAKDAAKLKRKLERISETFLRDLRKLKEFAELHELIPASECSTQIQSQLDLVPEEGSVSEFTMSVPSKKSKTGSSFTGSSLKLLSNFFRFNFKGKQGSEQESSKNSSKILPMKDDSIHSVELKTPSENASERHLQKIASVLAPPRNLSSLGSTSSKNENEINYIKIRKLKSKISPMVCNELTEEEIIGIVETHAKKYFPLKSTIEDNNTGHTYNVNKSRSGNQNQYEISNLTDQSEDEELGNVDSLVNQCPKDPETETTVEDNPNESTLTDETGYKLLMREMHESVLIITEQVRSVERKWLEVNTRLKPSTNSNKISDLLNYIIETIQLLKKTELQDMIYTQEKNDLNQAFETVYREVFSCFVALAELIQIVSTDLIYLRKFMEQIPKGDPIVYEYTSNSSLETKSLTSVGLKIEISNTNQNFVVDLDSIFD